MAVTMAIMVVTVPVQIVRSTLRVKRCFERREPCAESAQHVLDHVIAPDAQAVADDLDVDVTIANVPGEPRQLVRVRRCNLDQRLGAADDPNDPAVVEHDAIAIMQGRSLRQIEQKPRAALTAQDDTAAMPLMGIERNGIDGACGVPMTGGFDFARTLHA